MKILKPFMLILISALFFHSCSDDDTDSNSDQLNVTKAYHDQQRLINDPVLDLQFRIADELSSLAPIDPLIDEIVDISISNYDQGASDYEAFLSAMKNELLKSSDFSLLAKIARKGGKIKDEDYCIAPGLAVLIVGDINSKKVSDRIYIDDGFDDSNPDALIYYYEKGELGSHPISQEPVEKTLVVRISETYVDPKSEDYKLYTSDNTPYDRLMSMGRTKCGDEILNVIQTPTSDDGKEGKNPKTGCGLPCERDCVNWTDNLRRFQTTNDYDSGFRGKGEWYWIIIYADNVNFTMVNGSPVITGNALDWNNTGIFGNVEGNNTMYFPNYSSIVWNLANDGNRMRYIALESDGGTIIQTNQSLSFSFMGVSFTFNIPVVWNNGDDQIGGFLVDYCHRIDPNGINAPITPAGFQYNYGSARTWLNERN